ncbi:hypothetical protein JQ621_35040 [Bradyrhizobium manausense]|nr:hypothetical protein [Bradyrhizobium manausense]
MLLPTLEALAVETLSPKTSKDVRSIMVIRKRLAALKKLQNRIRDEICAERVLLARKEIKDSNLN